MRLIIDGQHWRNDWDNDDDDYTLSTWYFGYSDYPDPAAYITKLHDMLNGINADIVVRDNPNNSSEFDYQFDFAIIAKTYLRTMKML